MESVGATATVAAAPLSDYDLLLADLDALIESSQLSDVLCGVAADGNERDASGCAAYEHLDATTAASVTVKKLKCAAPGGNVARKRRREEIYALRDSVALLEEELRRLRAMQVHESSVSTSINSSSSSSNGEGGRDSDALTAGQSVPWRRPPPAAVPRQQSMSGKTQLTADVTAAQRMTELENIHLRKLVHDHETVTQKFERALRKWCSPVIAEVFLKKTPTSVKAARVIQYTQVPPTTPLPHTASDLLVFEALAKKVETMYHDFERVFEASGLTSCRSDMAETHIDTDDGADDKDVLLKFKSSRLMPFSVDAINETLLKLSQDSTGKGPGAAFEKTGQSVAYKKQFQAGGMSVSVRGVSRRYVESDRIVVVWESLSEWPRDGAAGGGETVVLRQKAWARVQAYPPLSAPKASAKSKQQRKSVSSASSPLSLLQSFIHMTSTAQEDGVARRNDARMQQQSMREAILTDVVLPFYEKAFAARIQSLENTLLEDSLKPRLEMAA